MQGGYNLCHFWSNFELGDLRFFRSRPYLDFFDWLDRLAPLKCHQIGLMQACGLCWPECGCLQQPLPLLLMCWQRLSTSCVC